MKGKLTLAAGVAIGYVIGSKQGRQSYEDLKSSAKAFWSNPNVQQQVSHAKDFAREQAPVAKDVLLDAAHKVADKASSGSSSGSSNPQYSSTYGTANGSSR